MVEIKKYKQQKINIIFALILNTAVIACLGWSIVQLTNTILNRIGSQLLINDWLLLILSITPIVVLITGYVIGFRSSIDRLISLILAGLFSLTMFAIMLALDIGNSIFMVFTNLTTWIATYAATGVVLIVVALSYSRRLLSRKK